jgi:hypothetical protein
MERRTREKALPLHCSIIRVCLGPYIHRIAYYQLFFQCQCQCQYLLFLAPIPVLVQIPGPWHRRSTLTSPVPASSPLPRHPPLRTTPTPPNHIPRISAHMPWHYQIPNTCSSPNLPASPKLRGRFPHREGVSPLAVAQDWAAKPAVGCNGRQRWMHVCCVVGCTCGGCGVVLERRANQRAARGVGDVRLCRG